MVELPPIAPINKNDLAAFCRVAAAKSRQRPAQQKNRPFLAFCDQGMVGRPPIWQTWTVVLPNLIHGSKKLNLA